MHQQNTIVTAANNTKPLSVEKKRLKLRAPDVYRRKSTSIGMRKLEQSTELIALSQKKEIMIVYMHP